MTGSDGSSGNGGGLYNDGTLMSYESIIEGNFAGTLGGFGGGVYIAAGSVLMSSTSVLGNTAGVGKSGYGGRGGPLPGHTGGGGGGIYNAGRLGTLRLFY